MIDPEVLIDKYYAGNPVLREILLVHSQAVAQHALKCVSTHPELGLDSRFVYEASMLHDIGIFLTDAPGIHCFGSAHYLCHGVLGGELLRHEGLPRHARVAERHTGTGLTAEQIVNRSLPLPHLDLLPETLEEQLVCYSDKFYSKSSKGNENPMQVLKTEKSLDRIIQGLERFGGEGVEKFLRWHELFA